MDTAVRTPQEVFGLPQHLLVPIFQRPYIWEEEPQWLPLWQDVRRIAEASISSPGSAPEHFLGAVVLQAQAGLTGELPTRTIIDGQQRLTTLQLLMDAIAAVLDEYALDMLARRMEELTHNQAHYLADHQSPLKIRHSNRDGDAFAEVMNAEPPVDHPQLRHAASRISRAHAFFGAQVRAWLAESDSTELPGRADALTYAVTRGLQLVVIDLKSDENSQEIFETLNARGTPLTAADLIKNFVFQRLAAEGSSIDDYYAKHWPFDEPYWEKDLSVGRYFISRGSLFLSQWLGSRIAEEVSPRSTFSRFKAYVEHEAQVPMSELLPEIQRQASMYRTWDQEADDKTADLDPVAMTVYRGRALQMETLKPLLIWLHHDETRSRDVINDVIGCVESWIVRRAILRLQTADLGRVVADLIRQVRSVEEVHLVGRVRSYLSSLSTNSSYWPGDEEIRRVLRTEPVYRRLRRSRLRMILEAIEDHRRGYGDRRPKGSARCPRKNFPIEHLMPQSWKTHWPVDGLQAEIDRSEHIHRIGNLTLLTEALNSSVSNAPWRHPNEGRPGKRETIDDHDQFLMNRAVVKMAPEEWTELLIDQRSEEMITALLETWPVPEGHLGVVVDPADASALHSITLDQLVASGLVSPGTELVSRAGQWERATATVTASGQLDLGGQEFDTPSGAARAVRKGPAVNGWFFWLLPDGRRLADVRREFVGSQSGFDWSVIDAAVAAIPPGFWTSYGDLAALGGTAAQPVGRHVAQARRPGWCLSCVVQRWRPATGISLDRSDA